MLISVLPLDFHERLRVIRSMFIPGALHGTEAFLLAVGGLLPKGLSGLVVSLWLMKVRCLACLMALKGVIPAYCVVWFWFRMLRGYLAYRTGEVGWVFHLLDTVTEGIPWS